MISEEIKQRLVKAGKRFYAGDNISSVLEPGDKQKLIDEHESANEKTRLQNLRK